MTDRGNEMFPYIYYLRENENTFLELHKQINFGMQMRTCIILKASQTAKKEK